MTSTPDLPPGPRELLAVWDDWSSGDVNRRASAKAEAAGNAEGAALLARYGDRATHATPLEALAASAELVRRMEGTRWLAMRDAREQGATWQQIGDAIGLTRQRALGIYQEALDKQERYVPDLHAPIAAAARAAAVDDPPTNVEPTWPAAVVIDPRGTRWERHDDGLWQDAGGILQGRPWQALWDVYGPLTPAPRVDAGDIAGELRESNRRQAAEFDARAADLDAKFAAYDAQYGPPGSPRARGVDPAEEDLRELARAEALWAHGEETLTLAQWRDVVTDVVREVLGDEPLRGHLATAAGMNVRDWLTGVDDATRDELIRATGTELFRAQSDD